MDAGMDPATIGIAPVPRTYPYDTCPTEVESLNWDPLNTVKIDEWPMNLHLDGAAFYVRDNSETPKDLTKEEEEAMERAYAKHANDVRMRNSTSTKSSYWNRPEKGVVIKTRAQRKEASAASATKEAGDAKGNAKDANETTTDVKAITDGLAA
eukprot:TRINITY_DN11562_c0_g1_i5.p2 TRINITY_DN11562_c0_g1~~TRINITY_DN11562_c0_g1_i5.p2  ORF type:complete len:153 (+),score=37.46 TRINITY_DN11562_c0_g1_i5:3322-3780(+)